MKKLSVLIIVLLVVSMAVPAVSARSMFCATSNQLSTVQFTDESTGLLVSREWSFGDGTKSNERNPRHVYAVGKYTVSLTTTPCGGSPDTATITDFVTVARDGRVTLSVHCL